MFQLPELPYAESALEPFMSAETLAEHHGKHHKKYVETLNNLIEGTPLEGETLEQVINRTSGSDDAEEKKIFNNAAQHWNHTFFWRSIGPDGGGAPDTGLMEMLERDFGGLAGFREEFLTQSSEHFGSGWAWLVQDDTALSVMTTHDADTPLAHGKTALLCCDLWEHAYYLDHKSKRPVYLEVWLDELVQWSFADENQANSSSGSQPDLTFAPEVPAQW